MLRSPMQKSRHVLPTWEALCSLVRPRILLELLPKTLRNGARLFARQGSSRSEGTAVSEAVPNHQPPSDPCILVRRESLRPGSSHTNLLTTSSVSPVIFAAQHGIAPA